MALPRCPVRGGSGNRSGTLRSRVAPAANHGHTGDQKPASYLSYDLHTAHTHTAHRTLHTLSGTLLTLRATSTSSSRPRRCSQSGAHELRLSATSKLVLSALFLFLRLRHRDRLGGGIHPRAPPPDGYTPSLSTKLPSHRFLLGPAHDSPYLYRWNVTYL